MKLRTLVALLAVCSMAFYGCDSDDGGTTDTTAPTDTAAPTDAGVSTDEGPASDSAEPGDTTANGNAWTDSILPMLEGYCTPCHTGGPTAFLTDASILDKDAGNTQPACQGQTVSECIHTTMADGSMPMGKSCPDGDGCPTQADIDAVKAWVDSGAAH
jgi:hypothetical protein